MANTAQSKKRARQADARYAVNKARRSRIRTFLRKVEEAIASGNGEAAAAADAASGAAACRQSLVTLAISPKFHSRRIAFRRAFLYNVPVTGKEAHFI